LAVPLTPTGWQRRYEARWLAFLARGGFTVYRVNRKIGLKRGATFEDLADDYALTLEGEFASPLDVWRAWGATGTLPT
jgi:hypothetical protein